MEKIYLNWAATSYRKPPQVIEAACDYLQMNQSENLGRGSSLSQEARLLYDAREQVALFFDASPSEQVIFTPNVTTALNMLIHGVLKAGDHVVTTSVEHNAVARPLHLLETQGDVNVTYVPCQSDGSLDEQDIIAAFREDTKLLVMNHASNVLGTILPVASCFQAARERGIFTLLDAAQTAGYLPLSLDQLGADAIAFTGHKSLMGLSGSGGFVLREDAADKVRPWLAGGTGSFSESTEMPRFLPDKFEPGTPNLMGILSLGVAVKTLSEIGLAAVKEHEEALTRRFLSGVSGLPVKVLGTKTAKNSVPVVSIVPKVDPGDFSQRLLDEYGIITRCGMHCAPLAHQTAGTADTGAVRFSFGYYTTFEEIDKALFALEHLTKGGR